jgi:bacteriophage N4 adsorption protein B
MALSDLLARRLSVPIDIWTKRTTDKPAVDQLLFDDQPPVLQRFIFVTQFYGVWQGLLSMPRMLLGNFINFLANWRAIAQVIKHGNPYRVSWDKTSHDFPMIGEVSRAHHMIGRILTRQGTLSTEQLRLALLDRPAGLRLGTWLVHSERITPLQLAHGIAKQFDLSCESIDVWAVKQDVIDLVPAHIALHYAVFPVRHDGTTLYLASESAISMVALAAIERQLGMKIKYFIALIGEVTVGLRHQYARIKHSNPLEELDQAIRAGQLDPHERQRTWDYYVSRQVPLGEILQSLGRIDTAVFSAVLLQHARTVYCRSASFWSIKKLLAVKHWMMQSSCNPSCNPPCKCRSTS